jgi:hypothetical protein
MPTTILQDFLDNRFIKTDDPDNIKNLKAASTEIEKQLKKKKPMVIAYALVAFDPTVAHDDSIVEDVEKVIIKKWPAFKNSVVNTKDTPISYVQAVILQALGTLSKDQSFAGIIWYSTNNVLSYYKLANQQSVLSKFLLTIGNSIEIEAQLNWGISQNNQIESFSPADFSLPSVRSTMVNEEELKGHLIAASMQINFSEQGGENPQYASHNSFQWPTFFSERASQGITTEINKALSSQNKALSSLPVAIKQSLDEYFAALTPYLEGVSSSIQQSSQSLNLRSNIMWWKQALYSKKLNTSYRTLSPVNVAVTMAIDLVESVPAISPSSVGFLLQEALRDVIKEEVDTEVTISDLIQMLSENTDQLNRQFKLLDDYQDDCRKSFASCILRVVNDEMELSEVNRFTNIDLDANISLGKLAVWLFHDLQAYKLSKVK